MTRYNLDIVASRGGILESRHRVHAAIVDHKGTLRASAGDPSLVTCWRSCAKPFQVVPFLESGRFDELGWGGEELALACASHGGEPEHVAIATRMLNAVGLEDGDLVCGAHEPLSRRGARLAQQSGEPLTRLHNNCSGKHAAMLAFARCEGLSTLGYERASHPVQQRALNAVSCWSGVPAEKVQIGVDGCGVIAFGLSLEAMARAFARFAKAASRGDQIPSRVLGAMRARPFLVGGSDRFDTILVEETGGHVVAKVGAEGVHTVAICEESLAFAIKVEDGATRAQHSAVLRLLQHLGVLPADLSPRLAGFLRAPIMNTRGEVVGEVGPVE